MRARALALFILILLVGIPLVLYWYFTAEKTASITVDAGSGSHFSIRLSGSFGLNGLPLADRVLSYTAECSERCTISPVLPAQYSLILTATGKALISDNIIVGVAEKIFKNYVLYDDAVFTQTGTLHNASTDTSTLIKNASEKHIGEFALVGTDIKNRVWVWRNMNGVSQIGILSLERFMPLRTLMLPIVDASLDRSLSVLIISFTGSQKLLLSVDLSQELEVSNIADLVSPVIVPGETWKIHTASGSSQYRGGNLILDPRFSDSIDLSSRIRIGYIDKNDTKRLSIGNFPPGKSVLVRLDRSTGESIVLRSGMDIDFFFYYNNFPAYADSFGKIFTINTTDL